MPYNQFPGEFPLLGGNAGLRATPGDGRREDVPYHVCGDGNLHICAFFLEFLRFFEVVLDRSDHTGESRYL